VGHPPDRSPSVREETQQKICVYCKQPITDRIYKRLDTGEAAHLACYIERMNDEENDAGR